MSDYLQNVFTKHIKKDEINIIVECGSRDCLDAIELNNYYTPDKIYSFECNSDSIIICKENIKNIENIFLIEKAVYNKNEKIFFYPTDMDKSPDKNIGASSLLLHINNKIGTFIQKEVEVDAIRLDTFINNERINKIDLLLFDLQGAEYLAIDGLGEKISNVHYLITEVSFRNYYLNDMLFEDFNKLIDSKGFSLIDYIDYGGFGDALYINRNW